MPDLTLSRLLSHLRDELRACEVANDREAPQLRAESVELEVSLAVVPGENGESELTLAQNQSESESAGLHRARIRFNVAGGGWQATSVAPPGNTFATVPPSREALLPDSIPPQQPGSADPEFNQADFDRMMDDIEGVAKKKKKRKKS